jgi:hypothetical protein
MTVVNPSFPTSLPAAASGPPSRHTCGFYWGSSWRDHLLASWVGSALQQGSGCGVMLGPQQRDGMIAALGELGVPARKAVSDGRLMIASPMPHQGPGASPSWTTAFWDDLRSRMGRQGHPLTHIVGERRWAGGRDLEREPLRCAAQLDEYVRRHGIAALCLYDLEAFPAERIGEVLAAHTELLINAQAAANPLSSGRERGESAAWRWSHLPLATALLSAVRNQLRLAELSAGLLRFLTDARLVACVLPGDDGWVVVGEELGRPLGESRRRELGRQVAHLGAVRDTSTAFLSVRGSNGQIVAIMAVGSPAGLAADQRAGVEPFLAVVGGCLERIGQAEEVARQVERRTRLERQVRTVEDGQELLSHCAARLADADFDGLLDLVASSLGRRVALVSADGRLVRGSRVALPARAVLRRWLLEAQEGVAGRLADPGRGILPLRDEDGSLRGALCLERPVEPGEQQIALGPLCRLLGATLEAEQRAAGELAGSEAVFLLSVLFSNGFPEDELVRWGRRLRRELGRPHRVALLSEPRVERAWQREERACSIRSAIQRLELDGEPLVAIGPDGYVSLLPDQHGWLERDWAAAAGKVLARSRSGGRIGVGAVGVGAGGIRRSYAQARALAVLQELPGQVIRVPDVAVYGETGLSELFVQQGNAEHLAAFARRVLGPLIEDTRFGGELIETLQAYLAASGSPRHAAASMHLHPSTIKYRMRIIRELIGSDLLDDHEARFELELALRVHRTLSVMGTGWRR